MLSDGMNTLLSAAVYRASGRYEHTLLSAAVYRARPDTILALSARGDVDANWDSPLVYAAARNNGMVGVLLDAFPSIDVNQNNRWDGRTALHWSAAQDNE